MQFKQFNMPFFMKIEERIIENLKICLETEVSKRKKVILGIDTHINTIYGQLIYEQLISIYYKVELIKIDDNSLDKCFEISNYMINNDYDIIIGVGGGKTLDVCKYTSYISKKTYIAIPTAISHDGIASPIAVLKCLNDIKSLGCHVPNGIIIDLNIIKKSPKHLIKAGIGDTLSNYTAIKDWKLASEANKSKIDDFAILLSELSVKSVINHKDKDIKNIDFLKTIVEACIMSGIAMNLAGSSRPCSGSEHLISHSIDKLRKEIPHGIQVGVSTIIANYLHGESPQVIINFLDIFELPTTLEELGVSYEEYLYIMKNAKNTRPNRYTILDKVDLDDDNLEQIYKKCFNK